MRFKKASKISLTARIFRWFQNHGFCDVKQTYSTISTDFLFFFERTREYYNFWDFELIRATGTGLITGKCDFSEFWGILLSSQKAWFLRAPMAHSELENNFHIHKNLFFSVSRFSATSLGSLRSTGLGDWFPVILEPVKLKLSFSRDHIITMLSKRTFKEIRVWKSRIMTYANYRFFRKYYSQTNSG